MNKHPTSEYNHDNEYDGYIMSREVDSSATCGESDGGMVVIVGDKVTELPA